MYGHVEKKKRARKKKVKNTNHHNYVARYQGYEEA